MNTAAAQGASARTRAMVECALTVALSVVFSHVKFFQMPQGGSITLEMAPLLYLAYRRGAGWGIAAGALSGAFQMLLGGYVVHPVQALLDYPLAFACVGVAGVSRAHPLPGPLLASLAALAGRLFCHTLSGVLFFAQFVPEWQNPWAYSIIYNASFMIPSMIVSGALAWALWRRMGAKR